MKSLLILNHVKVENANAIAGLTWGFPAISNFLGFSHALSRKLKSYSGLNLGRCAVVCHQHKVQAHQPAGWGDYVFSLTRNPLTKESKSPSFVEEARMHMDVSLLIECDFKHSEFDFEGVEDSDDAQIQHFIDWINNQAAMQRLAGGTITSIDSVQFEDAPNDEQRRILMRLLPGYVLVDRPDVLQDHHQSRLANDDNASLLDSWLDFSAMKHQAVVADDVAEPDASTPATWALIPRPGAGWLVPITIGYSAISPLYEPGEVKRTRDEQTPFRFVEAAYSIGQWVSPHRVRDLSSIFWRYQQHDDEYLCKNDFSKTYLTES